MREGVVEAAGISTAYLEGGAGDAVVLLHGSGPGVSARSTWQPTFGALAAGHRVLAPDLAGFGATERRPGFRYGLRAWLLQVVGFLDALRLERASLVGNSLGGALALALATHSPQRFDRLVLVGSAGLKFPVTPGLEAIWGYEPGRAAMRRVLEVMAYDGGLVTDDVVEARYLASVEPGVGEAFATMFPAPHQRWVDAMATPEDRIAALPQPTLLIHGRDDRVVPVSCAYRLAELIDRAQLQVYGRCGHWALVERADDVNGLVAQFLGARPRRPGGTG